MGFIVAFLVVVAIIGGLVYVLVIHREVPGAVEQRFGVLEPLPENVNQWTVDEESDEGKAALQQGLKRETRVFHDVGTDKLVRQIRYRNRATNEVARVEPGQPVKRRRVQA